MANFKNKNILFYFLLYLTTIVCGSSGNTCSSNKNQNLISQKQETIYWKEGRKLGNPNDPLVQRAQSDPVGYWNNVLQQIDSKVNATSAHTFAQWNATIGANINTIRNENCVSEKCLRVIEQMITNPLEHEWSAKMINSMKLLPTGLLSSTTTELGDFDQCLSISGEFKDTSFVGEYCFATVHLPRTKHYDSPPTIDKIFGPNGSIAPWIAKYIVAWYHLDNRYPIATGICFPSICSADEIRVLGQNYYPILKSFEFNISYCQSRMIEPKYDSRLPIALYIIAGASSLVAIAFVLEMFSFFETKSSKENLNSQFSLRNIIRFFAPIENIRKLFQITEHNYDAEDRKDLENDTTQFQFIHGLRAIGSVFVVMAHNFGLLVPEVTHISAYARYFTDAQRLVRTPLAHLFLNGGLIVHMFFVISGFLLTYHSLSASKLKIGFVRYVLLRWIRFAVPLIGMLCMSVGIEILGSGALWHHDLLWLHLRPCYDYWWINLLGISNWFPLHDQCDIQVWYLSAELQLHIVAFILLLVYVRSSRFTYLVSAGFIAAQALYVVAIYASGTAKLSLFFYYPFLEKDYFGFLMDIRLQYLFTFNHLVPFFTGAILGQMLRENRRFQLSCASRRTIWTLVTAFTVFMFANAYPMMQQPAAKLSFRPEGTLGIALLIYGLTVGWSLTVAWTMYECITDYRRNPVARFLSAKIFQPFSRISFCLFLAHLMTLWFNVLQTRSPVSLANLNQLAQFASLTLIESYMLAIFLHLTFEAPSVRVLKLLINNEVVANKNDENVSHAKNTQNYLNAINNNSAKKDCAVVEKIISKNRKDANANIVQTMKTTTYNINNNKTEKIN